MPQLSPRLTTSAAQSDLAGSLEALRTALGVPDGWSEDVLVEAQQAAAVRDETLPDLREIEFCTIDPADSTDLDQALHLARAGDGFLVHYAIADLPWFVKPGGAVDQEAQRRGQTLYAPDQRVSLHPEVIAEDAASLLPEQDRQAFVWRFELDAGYQVRAVSLQRGIVRSRKQWSYVGAQQAVDRGTATESLALLLPFGAGRQALESARGGASLNLPSGEVVLTEKGYAIERRVPLPIEDANAQLSLMTGMAAAKIMLDGGVGVLRTMPPAEQRATDEFRHQTKVLGLPWKPGVPYGDYLRSLDRSRPEALAVLQAATALFRGAGYEAFDGGPPEQPLQAAIAAPYAHVTAPIRRLVDRFGLVVCEALATGQPVPEWVRQKLPELPKLMAASDDLASRLDSGALDRVEAALLKDRADETFDAVVLSRKDDHRRIQLTDPVVVGSLILRQAQDSGEPGDQIRVTVATADIATGKIEFTVA
jgi:exoribonuclease R